jgi:putative transposase
MQEAVQGEVELTRRRSGWPARRTLRALGVARSSYYRWKRAQAWRRPRPAEPIKPVSVHEALAEEKAAVVAYARAHPAVRHRELAWRMVDEDVAYVSPSTVYRILQEAGLICPWRRREKRSREEAEKAKRPDERWATDLLQLKVGKRTCYLVAFLDEYSRYLVHWALLLGMDGATISLEAQRALEKLETGRGEDGAGPEIRSDNGRGYVSKDFRGVLAEFGLTHHRIHPHCPEENGLIERMYRTVREALDGEELENLLQARDVLARIARWYNEERLHSALGYLRPADAYRGDPAALQAARRVKLVQARHARKEANLKLRQRTLPLVQEESVA